MLSKIIVGGAACILGYFGINGYTSSIFGVIQTNRHNINIINTKLEKMQATIDSNFKGTNHIINKATTKLENMDSEINTKLNKIDNDVYTIHTNIQDSKLIIDDIKNLLLSSPGNKYLDKPLDKSPQKSYISWFI